MEEATMDYKVSGKMEEAFYKLIEEVLPLLKTEEGRASFQENLNNLSKWISITPNALHQDKPWTREEFKAALTGPEEMKDPRFGAYMDSFYEEYASTPEDRMQAFYDDLFHAEQELSEVDWLSVWESVRASYEDWLKKKDYVEDAWLKGEQKSGT